MGRRRTLLAGVGLAVLAAACAARETAAHRVLRARRAHRVEPLALRVAPRDGGGTKVSAELLVVNTAREGLRWLTVRVHLQGADGTALGAVRVPVDVSSLVPGVPSRVRAGCEVAGVAGVARAFVEVEDPPPASATAEIRELSDLAGEPS